MANTFIGGFAEGANTGLRLRDYEQNRRRQDRRDSMAEQAFATQQRNANLQYDVAQEARTNQRGLRDLGQLEYALQTGTPSPQAQRAYEKMFRHYGGNTDQAEADVTELERAASTGDADENTRQAFNRVYADEINQGGPANTYKEVADIWPTKNGVTFDLEMTRPDGSKYRAPMTSPNRDETDKEVAVVPWDTLFTDLKARKAALDMVRGRRVGLGDTAPLTALQAAEAQGVARRQKREDFVFEEDYKRQHDAGKSPWKTTSLGGGRFIMTNSQTGERRLPTAEELQTLGGAGGKVQTVTFTDEDGNKVPMERTEDGSWKPIVPEGMEGEGVGPAGLTWDQAMERAKAMASEKAGFFSSDKTDFGAEGRQGAVTRMAQELYQGQQVQPQQGLDTGRQAPPAQRPAQQQPRKKQEQPLGTAASPYTGISPEEAMRLPPGTYVMDDAGNLRVVPERAQATTGLIDRQGAR